MGMNRMFIRWTRSRWAGPSPSLSLLNVDLDLITLNLTKILTLRALVAAALSSLKRPPPPPPSLEIVPANLSRRIRPRRSPKEVVPIQMIAPTSAVPVEQPLVPNRRSPKKKFRIPASFDDEIVEKRAAVEAKEVVPIQMIAPTSAVPVEQPLVPKRRSPKKNFECQQVLMMKLLRRGQLLRVIAETAEIVTNIGEPDVQRADEIMSTADISPADLATLDFHVFTNEDERLIETESDTEDMEIDKNPEPLKSGENDETSGFLHPKSAPATYFLEEPIEETKQNQGTEIADMVQTADRKISDDESMTLEEHLSTIPDGSSLPSTTGEVTKILFGKSITIRGVDEGDWYKASLPKIPAADKGKAPLQERDPIKGNPAKEIFSLIIADIEFLVQLREKVIDEVDAFLNSFSPKSCWSMAKTSRSAFCNSACALVICVVVAGVNASQRHCSLRLVVFRILRLVEHCSLRLVFGEMLRLDDDVSGATPFELVATLRFDVATGTSRERSDMRCFVLATGYPAAGTLTKAQLTFIGAIYAVVRYDEDLQRRIFLTIGNKEYK
ncbi:pentatricopeptide repeat-containing protein [Dorcoceras hygrometricum]|uniref:Pentatricopeptide repeat-containing protein n=1 Tax=Dorcoceras hygrometricum TaxID=472368 RepID=A0A2Z7BTY8_9LAMI|nr:pentatricopeptide repeat-containing protein [Dorcoceras hygrometricum]